MDATTDQAVRLNDSGKLAAEFILKHIGENPKREGLVGTPQRFSKALFTDDERVDGAKVKVRAVLVSDWKRAQLLHQLIYARGRNRNVSDYR